MMKKNYMLKLGFCAFFRPVLFLILVLSMTFQGYGQTKKGKISTRDEKWEKGGFFEGYSPNQELLEKRSKTTKHFRNENGTITAQIGGIIHYQDNNGAWQDINFDVTKSESAEIYKFVNETNEYKSYFPQKSNAVVQFKLNNQSTLNWWKTPVLKFTSNGNTIQSFEMNARNGVSSKNTVKYENVYPNITEEFEVLPNGLENNTIISALTQEMKNLPANAMLEFSQVIELKSGWKILADGKVQTGDFNARSFNITIPGFEDGLTFNPIFVYDKKLTKDDALMLVFSPKDKLNSKEQIALDQHVFQCDYKAEFVEGGLKITTILPVSWLKNTLRAFPVTIDPIVTIGTTPGTGDFRGPITHWYGFQRHADLYLQSEIGGYGLITDIEFYKTGTQAARTKPTKVYMRDVANATLTGTDAWNSSTYTGGLTPLFDGNTTQDNVAGWKMITLTTPHLYASGNLLIMIYDQYGGSGSAQYFTATNLAGTQRQAFKRQDTTDPGDASTTAVENYLPAIRITYTVPTSGPPVITSFTPTVGCTNTGVVVITGENFFGTTDVTIGGTAVLSYVVNSQTQITATVGTGTTGTISITTPNGTVTSIDTFTVNDSPANSPIMGGSSSVIVGDTTPAFTNATAGGVWAVVNGTGSATIDVSGVVTGVSLGTATVTYTTTNGVCSTTVTYPILISIPNDECSGAIALTVNGDFSCGTITPGTVAGATASSVDATACAGTEDDDVWFSFVATNTIHRISLLNITGSVTDMYHSLWTGDCGNLTLVTGSCSDPNTSNPSGLVIGQTYYVRVYTYTATSGQNTTFNICIGTPPPPPANDECSGAIALTVNGDYSCGTITPGTVAGATASSVDATACGGTEDDDVWFSFVATNTTHRISLLNVAGSVTDMYHSLWTGDCGNLTLVTGSCSDPNASTPSGLVVGQTYYVRVYTVTATAGQDTAFNICIGTPPPPPANDECSGAIALTVNGDFSCGTVTPGTVAGATASSVDATACAGTEDDDVWFSFVATNIAHRISLLNIAGSVTDMYHSLWTGDCSNLTLVAGGCSDPNTSNPSGLVIGQTYYVRVNTYTATGGQDTVFNICIGTPPPPPANDECANAIPLIPGGNYAQNAVDATVLGATGSTGAPAPGCANYLGGDIWYSVEVPNDGNITIETGNSSAGGTGFDSGVAAYSGTCGNLTLIECDDDDVPGTADNYSLLNLTGLTPGAVIYVRVWEYTNDEVEPFSISAYNVTLSTASFNSNNFHAYPNPVKDVLNLEYTSPISKVQVINLLGQVVISNQMNTNSAQIDLSQLNTGAYIVNVTIGDTIKTLKIVKE